MCKEASCVPQSSLGFRAEIARTRFLGFVFFDDIKITAEWYWWLFRLLHSEA